MHKNSKQDPKLLIEDKIRTLYPSDATNIISALSKPRPTTFRINHMKNPVGYNPSTLLRVVPLNTSTDELYGILPSCSGGSRIEIKKGPIPDSYIVIKEGDKRITETEAYNQGLFYVQELSSQIPALVLDPKPGEKILDLCASPGSKTTQIGSLIEKASLKAKVGIIPPSAGGSGLSLNDSEPEAWIPAFAGMTAVNREDPDVASGSSRIEMNLVAVEKNKPRFFILKHNVEMQGVTDCKLMLEDGITLYKKYPEFIEHFDKILVDAPCSNEGSINFYDPRSYKFWNSHKYKEMSRIQKGLIISGARMLKKGGVLVYSTCTFSVEENEEIVNWLMLKMPEMKLEHIELPITNIQKGRVAWKDMVFDKSLAKTVRVIPDGKFTGFYVAKLRKLQ